MKRYAAGTPVIDGFSHTFRPGTATGLVGPNGAGKTTLLRLLAATAYPTAGRVRYGALDVHAKPYRYLRHVGLVYAAPELPQHLTAVELLEWIARERGAWGEGAAARHAALLDAVRLDERRHALIGTYSSGMVQKTQVAAALVHRPAVLLLDEPFRALDAASTEAVLALLRAFAGAGGVLVVSSHAHALLGGFCDVSVEMGAVAAPGAASPGAA
ncbi:MAG: ABC transporter ATP-binding protein [Rhodothermales bacterium]|nr:ABC transporter ATP-binding protein [Rhodothermales bacterium]